MEFIDERVKKLQEIPQPIQHSKEWFDIRKTCLTASSDISIITQESYKHTHLKENHDHLLDILILKKNGIDIEKFTGNVFTEWGNKYELLASKIYENEKNKKVIEFGLLKHQTIDCVGASPDGITTDGIMLEIKCPSTRKITGKVPRYYWVQIQTQLQVCNLDLCDFMECSFKETAEEDLQEHDNYKGCIYQLYPNKFIYPEDITKSIQEQKQSIVKQLKFFNTSKLIFWKLEKHSCVQVKRNNEWWDKHINNITNTWDKIKYYFENKEELKDLHDKVLNYIQKKEDDKYPFDF